VISTDAASVNSATQVQQQDLYSPLINNWDSDAFSDFNEDKKCKSQIINKRNS
jgi:hypothetical protein